MAFGKFLDDIRRVTSTNTQQTQETRQTQNTQNRNTSKSDGVKDAFKEIFRSNKEEEINEIEKDFLEALDEIKKFEEEEVTSQDTEATTEEKDAETIIKNASVGDVFKLPNENKAFIKTANGETKELNISYDTYERLFKNSDVDTFSGLTSILAIELGREDEYNIYKEYKNYIDIYKNESNKYNLLDCFSENENGDITVTIPSTQYSFTFTEDLIKEYGITDEQPGLGIQMLNIAYNAMYQENRISELKEYVEIRDDYLENEAGYLSEEFKKEMEEIAQYAFDNGISDYEINKGIELLKTNAKDKELMDSINPDILNLLSRLSQEEIKNLSERAIGAIIEKVAFNNELKQVESVPLGKLDMGEYYSDTDLQTHLGLDINGNPISEGSLSLAEEFLNYSQFEETIDFNKYNIAAYLNNNPNGEKILDAVMTNEELCYNPNQAIILLKESLKENADIEFLTKAATLNWPPALLFNNNLLTPNNIDLAILFNEKYGNENIPWKEFRLISNASKLLPIDTVKEYIENGTYEELREPTEYINNIMPIFQNDGTIRSNLLMEDVNKVYQAALEGKNIADLIVPTTSSINEGMQNARIGDIFEVEGENNIFIKTSDGEYEQLNISKETYLELFPPVQRYVSSQGSVGDCYLVSTLNNMLTDPTLRHIPLKCFSEDENGNVTVDLPNGDYTFTLEKGKKVTDYESPQLLSDSSTGMQMLELCYGIYLKDEEIKWNMDELALVYENIPEEEKESATQIAELIASATYRNCQSQAQINYILYNSASEISLGKQIEQIKILEDILFSEENEEFETLLTNYIFSGYSIDSIIDLISANTYINNINELQEDTYGTEIRGSGGLNKEVFSAFGIDCSTNWFGTYSTDEDYSIEELLTNPNIRIVSGGTYGTSDNEYLNEELRIAGRHAYTLYPIKQDNGEWLFEVVNPWEESRTVVLTMEQMNEYFRHIDYITI